jgi:hypothetical protein
MTVQAWVDDQFHYPLRIQPARHFSIVTGPGRINPRTGGFTAGWAMGMSLIKVQWESQWKEAWTWVI